MKKILIVGGNFDETGRPSGLISKITSHLIKISKEKGFYLEFFNGGTFDFLKDSVLPSVKSYDIVLWGANVPNEYEKIRNVKEINPKAILVSTKRNNNEYGFAELVSRALAQKSNLVLEFNKIEDLFKMRIFDPLGNVYYDGFEVEEMAEALMDRALKLTTFTRIPSIQESGEAPAVPDEEEFFAFARECSDIFHNLIKPAENTQRFLGNMSFRCQNGFPSFKKDGIIYVSRRNVDKRFIEASSFVPTFKGEDGSVRYYGDNKPSVDTPVQHRLYELFPEANYMIHAHCYFDYTKALCTTNPVPCGAIEEVEEIVKTVKKNNLTFDDNGLLAINLRGHGCILFAKDVKTFTNLISKKDNSFVKRVLPEYCGRRETI